MEQGGGMHELDAGGELDMAVAGVAGEVGHGQRQHRPQALAPGGDQMVATSGIMVTSEPVRDRIVALTRSMSPATRATSSSIDAPGVSKGTMTATPVSNICPGRAILMERQ